jgi:hypothetical protein
MLYLQLNYTYLCLAPQVKGAENASSLQNRISGSSNGPHTLK